MGSRRDELEALSREELVQQALALGVPRAASMTRLDLIDEIVAVSTDDEQERNAARGLLGLARDLVARVMEKGLHLPDAASRLRTLAPGSATTRKGFTPLPTVALAQVYASQGHRNVALEVIDEVLQREPGNQAAAALRDRLSAGLSHGEPQSDRSVAETPPLPPPAPEATPARGARAPQRPPTTVRDQLSLEPREAGDAHLHWRVLAASFARARASKPHGRLVLRVVHVMPRVPGPEVRVQDIEVDALSGRLHISLQAEREGTCAAVGWRCDDAFEVFATDTGA